MKSIEIKIADFSSKIFIGESLDNLKHFISANSIIISDKNVVNIYRKRFPDIPIIQIEPGEKSKSLSNIEYICTELLGLGADRDTQIIGIGGGVVTDITGFVASIFKRGLKFAFVPTTLLGQADASIGGKNGINFSGIKNLIGTIIQPQFIISDISLLNTLSKKEMMNGICEIIKTALVGSEQLYGLIEDKYEDVFNFYSSAIEEIVFCSAKVKAGIVEKDEKESGIRRILNFGHTFGHAMESVSGCTHGEAVGLGLRIALKLSGIKLNLSNEIIKRVNSLLSSIGVPEELNFDKENIITSMLNDKKKYAGLMKFVLLKDISQPVVAEFSIQELKRMVYDMR